MAGLCSECTLKALRSIRTLLSAAIQWNSKMYQMIVFVTFSELWLKSVSLECLFLAGIIGENKSNL